MGVPFQEIRRLIIESATVYVVTSRQEWVIGMRCFPYAWYLSRLCALIGSNAGLSVIISDHSGLVGVLLKMRNPRFWVDKHVHNR